MRSHQNFLVGVVLAVVCAGLLAPSSGGTVYAAEFRGLGVGAGTDEATGVSGDGTVVVGRNVTGTLGYRWSEADGVEYLGAYPDDVSLDGSVIVGTAGFCTAVRWTRATGAVPLNDVNPNWCTLGLGVSADGSVVVGSTSDAPFHWTSSGGFVTWPTVPEGARFGVNNGLSADGSVTVGVFRLDVAVPPYAAGEHYYRAVDGVVTEIPGLLFGYSASGVSADGNVAFGQQPDGAAAYWSGGNVTVIGGLPGYEVSFVEGASASGDCFAGSSWDGTSYEAIFWDDVNGLRRFRDVLEDDFGLGADLTGWTLTHAVDVDDDCTTIVGTGIDADGHSEAWVVTGFSKNGVQALCAQPTSTGLGPVASDCLFILNVAVGTQVCPIDCVCAPKGTLPASATDALMCLQSAVGQSIALECPCSG